MAKIRSIIFPIFIFLLILVVSAGLIAYGRGYRIDFSKSSLKSTGLLAATSDPVGAQVFIDGKLKTATNNSIPVEPGKFTVSVTKEGYLRWEKMLKFQPEIVTRADAFLFPTNPSLSPLTATGVERPVLSPDGTKVAYTIPLPKNADQAGTKRAGLWVLELAERPLGRNRDPRQVGTSDATFDFTTGEIRWSPDSRNIMATNGTTVRVYDSDRTNSFEIQTPFYKTILADWETERATKERQKLEAFKQPIIDIATASAKVISFSPDETKILYEATAAAVIPKVIDPPLIGTNSTEEVRKIETGKLYVYDSREDRNYFVLDKKEIPVPKAMPTPKPKKGQLAALAGITIGNGGTSPLQWFPTSRHLVLTLEGKIDIMEFDRTNWITIYSGPFVDGFIAPWPNGSRIIVMTNLNPNASTLPNLYTVNLR